MRAIKADLSEELQEIEVMLFADWHWADPHSNHENIKKDLAYVAEHDNCFCVLNGDLMNCAIKSSVSDTYAETLSPMEELRICTELFSPIKDKILCVTPGNHERRHYKTNGIDITEMMCRQLGIEDRYSPATALLFIRFGKDMKPNGHHRKVLYTMYVTHGNGGGRKEGGKVQRLVDLSTIVDADIYVCGHTHLPAMLKDSFVRPNMSNSSVSFVARLFVNTSSKLDYGGYGEVMGFKANCQDSPIIHLSGTRKEMRATL